MMAGDEKPLTPTGSLGTEYQCFEDVSDDVTKGTDVNDVGISFNCKPGSEPTPAAGYFDLAFATLLDMFPDLRQ